MRKRNLFWLIPLCVIILFAAVVGGYFAYGFLAYSRLPDELELEILAPEAADDTMLRPGETYTAVTYNIGFGAYIPEFSFFMDGGTESTAFSKEAVEAAVRGAGECARDFNPDFVLFQEVDLQATRSFYVNQVELLRAVFPEYYFTFGINYDSPFLMYPLKNPHGRSKAGLANFSRFPIVSAVRYSLPISDGFEKFYDLDRCYVRLKVPVSNGKFLDIYHVHLSAYSDDARIREGQFTRLMGALEESAEQGNYVLCTGDFNYDMRNLQQITQVSWAHIFPRERLPKGFVIVQDTLPEEERAAMPDSSRNADIPYDPEKSMTITLDAFIASDNLETVSYQVYHHGFLFSDHQPVLFSFRLK